MSARCTEAAVQVSCLSWKSAIKKLDQLRSTLAILTHWGPETRILVFGVFSLQLWKTDDANLPYNTRVDFTHLITQYIKQQK
jgi:hypothetical protein